MTTNIYRKTPAAIAFSLIIGIFTSGSIIAEESHKGGTVGHRASLGPHPHVPPKESEQQHDLKNETIRGFKHEIISENSIRVSFQTGSPNCVGDRAVLEESDDTIGIAVITGTLIGAPKYCAAIGALKFFVLHTKRPIGNRKIVELTSVELK